MTCPELLNLTAQDNYPSVSIHLPTAQTGRERMETPIRIRNLAKQVEEDLVEDGVRESDAQSLLRPIRDYAEQGDWLHQGQGLALFASQEGAHFVETPYPLSTRTIIDRRFFVRPLIPIVLSSAYYVLVLDLHDIRLLRGDRDVIKEIHVPGLPHRREDVTPIRHPQKETQGHTVGRVSSAHSLITHGGRNVQDEEREQTRHLLQVVARIVQPIVATSPAPVILAGVDYLTAMFRELSDLPLANKVVEGSPKTATNESLRDRASQIVAERRAQAAARDASRFSLLLGTGLSSDHLSEVVPAAIQGRVETLFIRDEFAAWGRYDAESGRIHHSALPGRNDEELLNLAAMHVLRDGGVVYECSREEMPDGNAVAAIFRY